MAGIPANYIAAPCLYQFSLHWNVSHSASHSSCNFPCSVCKKSQAAAQIILGFFESLVSVSFGWAVGRRAKCITRTQNSLVHQESMTAVHMSSAVTIDEIYHTVCGSYFGSSVDLGLQQFPVEFVITHTQIACLNINSLRSQVCGAKISLGSRRNGCYAT